MSEARLELVEGANERPHLTCSCGNYCFGGYRQVLTGPTDLMVEAAHEAATQYNLGAKEWNGREMFRAALAAAFNTLGIQEKVE
jgi:hypothetical protein